NVYLCPQDTPPERVKELLLLKLAEEGLGSTESLPIPVTTLLDKWLLWVKMNRSPASFAIRRYTAEAFGSWLKKRGKETMSVTDLTPFVVTEWMASHGGAPNAQRTHLSGLKTAFSWAVEQKLIPTSPLRDLKMPKLVTRGDDMFLPEQIITLLLSACHKEE